MSRKRAGGSSGHRTLLCLLAFWVFSQLLQSGSACAIEPDKMAHFNGAAILGIAIDTVTYHYATGMGPASRMATSAGLAFFPELCIEIGDEFAPRNHFGVDDLLAGGVGAVFGAVAAEIVNGQFWISASGRQLRLIGRW